LAVAQHGGLPTTGEKITLGLPSGYTPERRLGGRVKNRIRFISHKDKKILLVDCSNCTVEQLEELSALVLARVTAEPRGSVLLLADFTGATLDRHSVDRLKPFLVFDRPYLKRSAWVGVENLPKVFYEHLKSFSQRELPTFKTREEAMDWLVED
jgi:hypothetical protein